MAISITISITISVTIFCTVEHPFYRPYSSPRMRRIKWSVNKGSKQRQCEILEYNYTLPIHYIFLCGHDDDKRLFIREIFTIRRFSVEKNVQTWDSIWRFVMGVKGLNVNFSFPERKMHTIWWFRVVFEPPHLKIGREVWPLGVFPKNIVHFAMPSRCKAGW